MFCRFIFGQGILALPNALTYTFDSWKKLRCQKKRSLWYLSMLYCAKCLFFCRRKNILFKAIANFPFFCSLLVVFARAAILRLLYEPLLFVPRLNKHLTEHFCIIYRGFPPFCLHAKNVTPNSSLVTVQELTQIPNFTTRKTGRSFWSRAVKSGVYPLCTNFVHIALWSTSLHRFQQ